MRRIPIRMKLAAALMVPLLGLVFVTVVEVAETAAAVEWAASYPGPVFLRLSRVGVPDLLPEDHRFELGRADRLRDGVLGSAGLPLAELLELGIEPSAGLDLSTNLSPFGAHPEVLRAVPVPGGH